MRTFDTEELTIVDVGSYLAATTPLELEIYSIAIARIPCAFLGEPQNGVLRRPGVLWTERERFADVDARVRARMLHDNGYVEELRERFEVDCAALDASCAERAIDDVWRGLADVMPYMAFNWLLPREELDAELQELTGLGEEELASWVATVSTPRDHPHFMRFRLALLQIALEPTDAGVERFARDMGKLQNSLIEPADLEDPANVWAEALRIADDLGGDEGIHAEIAQLEQVRQEKLAARERALGGADARVRTIADLLQLAADEEEERHVLQMRSLTLLRLEAEERGADLVTCTSADLDLPQLVEARPRIRAHA